MKKIVKIATNKYIIATVIFAAIIIFTDDYSLRVSSKLRRQVDTLHNEEIALRQAIVDDSAAAVALRNNIDAKEHYGRENYYMKRSDEDIFVIK